MKKIISLILVLVLVCTALVSCKKDAPNGMKSVTVSGEPFILYVPEVFTTNTSSGISSAFYRSVENDILVTARYYTPADSEMTIDEYMNFCADAYAESLEGFSKTAELAGDILYGVDARRLEYKMTEGEVAYEVTQISAKHKGDFVSLNVYTTGDGKNVYSEYITMIVENFTLTEKSEAGAEALVDKNTPAGMKIASNDIVEYRLYVPSVWVCDADSGVSEAYYPESEKTNVTVTSYSPATGEKGMSLSKYVEKCIEEYRGTISGFPEVVAITNDLMVAEKEAVGLEFTAEYDGVVYKLRQVIFYASEFELYYTFTYTAIDTKYNEHMADFEAMLSAFSFR